MTDKQIIIDGVRVDECCWFDYENDGYKDSCYMFQNECSAQNCYYKQLQAKEQECEELKEQLERKEENYQKLLSKSNKYIHNLVDENIQDISNLARQLDQLKAENEELKEIIQRHDNDNNALLKEVEDELCEYYRRDRECLTDIKEIAENMNKECFYNDFDCEDCDMKNGCTYQGRFKILQKISEVE